jgi:hypothetical protein
VLGAQAVAAGGKLIVCDRHATDPSSLAARLAGLERHFLLPVARTEDEIVGALQHAYDVLERRMAGDPDRSLVLVMGEELTALFVRMRDKVEPCSPPSWSRAASSASTRSPSASSPRRSKSASSGTWR